MPTAAKPIPEGIHTLTPHLVCDGATKAIDFYKAAFGATEELRLPGPDGRLMHALLRIGDSALMLVDEWPDMGAVGPNKLQGSSVTLHLYVTDADASYARAVAAGATAVMPPADMFWGDRYSLVKDPFGHMWSIATHQHDYTVEQIRENMAKMPNNPC